MSEVKAFSYALVSQAEIARRIGLKPSHLARLLELYPDQLPRPILTTSEKKTQKYWRRSALAGFEAFLEAEPVTKEEIDSCPQKIIHEISFESVLELAKARKIPADSLLWWIEDKYGTVAHVAAVHGWLPVGFSQWELATKDGRTVAHFAAAGGCLPAGFDKWELASKSGWTVAHTAASNGKLPDGFDRWELATPDGFTVAHAAAMHGHLPEGFDQWELATKFGCTVAQYAAMRGHLPEGFDRWELKDKDGKTVAHAAAMNGKLPKGFDRWELADGKGKTVRQVHEERFKMRKVAGGRREGGQ
ncbi:MAG: hypothetical protein LBW85_09740 [Deltaproteobacteria bacterium]|jgi:hypothetical protein|nr:hypothetical protein [Deltaproteobacteria bacterium]